jgi:pimeloyl-ACP methyl ester carboxylesterase
MAEAAVNGVQLRYELTGSGDAVVFVHGALLDHHDWDVVSFTTCGFFPGAQLRPPRAQPELRQRDPKR